MKAGPAVAGLDRRAFLRGLGLGTLAVATGCGPRPGVAFWRRPAVAGAPPVEQLHLQFGADAAREMVVSWATADRVARPRVRLGTPSGGYGRTLEAATRTYTDGKSRAEVVTHHASLAGLEPATTYVYEALHDGGPPLGGSFTTAPAGRAAFRFTSFGDQATPAAVDGMAASPWSGYVVSQIERLGPLFHLLNGDLCYANLSLDRVATWSHFFANNMPSARHRPWMPAIGNHENERGNGPHGFQAYQTRFQLPDNGAGPDLAGNWYAFTVGAMRVVSLSNDDVCYQDGGDSYVRGYSGGLQKAWLERTLAAARRDAGIDWLVVCMHQTAISSADHFNGCDRGIREELLPLFDRYGVDLVVCGHEHHYERSHPLRGADRRSETLTPLAAGTRTDVIDTSAGTVHVVVGTGGTAAPSNGLLWTPPQARVIVGVGPGGAGEKRAPIYLREDARGWSAARDTVHSYGFACFDVDPGDGPGSLTRITATFYATADAAGAEPVPVERFTLQRPRSDQVS